MSSPSNVKKNIVANLIGRICFSLISIVFVPIYIKFLGIEAYGLIGIYVTLTGLLVVLDLGLSSTLTRELARLSVMNEFIQEARDLVRTIEILYWSIGIVIGICISFMAPVIANQWVHPKTLNARTVEDAIRFMGFIAACEWPISLYSGGLNGLQKQVLLNFVRTVAYVIQYGGAALILWLVAPTISAYFKWQILISSCQAIILCLCLWNTLPHSTQKPRFRKSLLKRNYKFAVGMTGITIMVTILTQLDKVILSKFLTLEFFGYYSLAFSISMALSNAFSPITLALFPRYTQLVEENNTLDLISLYHQSCQTLAATVLPIATLIAFYSKEILTLWLNNKVVVENTYILLSLLIIGMAFNSLVSLPYTMQLAHGWTKLSFFKNVVAVVVLTPLMYLAIMAYGSIGAACIWIILNLGYFFIEIPIMHKKLLKEEMWKWYANDVSLPLCLTIIVLFTSRLAMPTAKTGFITFFWILSSWMISQILNILIIPYPRFILFEYINKYCSCSIKKHNGN